MERIPSAPLQRAQSTSDINNNIEHDRNSDNGSVASDMFVNGTRIMTLRAADAEVCPFQELQKTVLSHYIFIVSTLMDHDAEDRSFPNRRIIAI